jgi:hypothetical protein
MPSKRILLIGIDPNLVDFSRSRERSAESVKTAGNTARERLTARGYEVRECLVDLGETAESVVEKTLSETTFDCIMIGAGIRALPQHTLLFERIINAVHRHAPSAKLSFNSKPEDTVEAILRWT